MLDFERCKDGGFETFIFCEREMSHFLRISLCEITEFHVFHKFHVKTSPNSALLPLKK
jgi:hypothetical protein